ncbi:unnamed protein product [Rotaria socialis]
METSDPDDLTNLLFLLGHPMLKLFKLGRLVAQSGFAGDDIVPEEKRLSKFNGRITCPAFNLAADTKAAELCSYFRERKLQKFPLSSKSSEVKEKYFPRF